MKRTAKRPTRAFIDDEVSKYVKSGCPVETAFRITLGSRWELGFEWMAVGAAGSPLLALSGPAWLGDLLEAAETPGEVPRGPIITSPNEAINVFDFEAAAREKLPPAHLSRLRVQHIRSVPG